MTKDKTDEPKTEKPQDNNLETEPTPKHSGQNGSTDNKLKNLWHSYLAKKKLTFPLTALVLLILIFAIPFSRYQVLGLFIKQQFGVEVLDSKTGNPVTNASVSLAGVTVKSNNQGKAVIKAKVGSNKLQVTKKYYADFRQNVTVPLSKSKQDYQVKLNATGRQVPVTITDKISGQGMENVTIKVSDTEAKTDKDGTVTIVLPAGKTSLEATLSANGYNDAKVTIKVTEQKDVKNNFSIVPAGQVYFLSNQSGKIDVVKTNLDGTDRQTVLAGTGKEDSQTVLLASPDWKYLALLARRDSKLPKLYLINTSTNKLTTIDEGNANFTPRGWLGDSLIYTVDRNDIQDWQPKKAAIKSYNASSNKLSILDETSAQGSSQYYAVNEYFGDIYILRSTIVYIKNWQVSYQSMVRLSSQQAQFISIQADGSHKSTLKSIGVPSGTFVTDISLNSRQYEPEGIYLTSNTDNSVYKYEDGNVNSTKEVTSANFYDTPYPVYFLSPDGNQTLWSEQRDGKNTLFIGNKEGKDSKQIAALNDFGVYGWYDQRYVLISKKANELYIMSSHGGSTLKISNYYGNTGFDY